MEKNFIDIVSALIVAITIFTVFASFLSYYKNGKIMSSVEDEFKRVASDREKMFNSLLEEQKDSYKRLLEQVMETEEYNKLFSKENEDSVNFSDSTEDYVGLLRLQKYPQMNRIIDEHNIQNSEVMHQYFRINQSQIKFIFPLGIAILIMGLLLIALSFVVYFSSPEKDMLVLFLGGIFGFFVDLIGVLFIKIYINTMNATSSFHDKIVTIMNIDKACRLVDNIVSDENRDKTYNEIAIEIIKTCDLTKK